MAVMGTTGASKPSKVKLVPWDPANEEHFKRMVEQRHACGWGYEEVPEWREKALRGEKFLYWIQLADNLPDKEKILKSHFDEFPSEKTELVDTSTSVAGTERIPTQEKFFPIGHIGLQIGDGRTKEFNLPVPESAIWIKSLYISFALQSQGLGRSSMAAMEDSAALPPLNADLVVLDTVESSFQLNEEHMARFWEGRGRKRPEVPKANQEWYARQGYQVIKVVQNATDWTHPATGETHALTMVFMSKRIGGQAAVTTRR